MAAGTVVVAAAVVAAVDAEADVVGAAFVVGAVVAEAVVEDVGSAEVVPTVVGLVDTPAWVVPAGEAVGAATVVSPTFVRKMAGADRERTEAPVKLAASNDMDCCFTSKKPAGAMVATMRR